MAKFPALPVSVEEESKNRGQRIGRPPISQLEKVGVLFSSASGEPFRGCPRNGRSISKE